MLAKQFAIPFLENTSLQNQKVVLDLEGYRIALLSNSTELLERLSAYFSFVVAEGDADIEITCIESEPAQTGLAFTDWPRETGKTGRKDAYHELEDGRVIYKIRTGMIFLQSESHRLALISCTQVDGTIIRTNNSATVPILPSRVGKLFR